MSRPDLNQLAPTSSNNAINGTPELYYGGTAGLRPIKAYQADFSIEWYYAPHSALTAALFGKRIVDDIYTATQTSVDLGTMQYVGGPPGTVPGVPFLWTVQAPANGAKSIFTGLEVSQERLSAVSVVTRTASKRSEVEAVTEVDAYGRLVVLDKLAKSVDGFGVSHISVIIAKGYEAGWVRHWSKRLSWPSIRLTRRHV
jgi:hypothetical protein